MFDITKLSSDWVQKLRRLGEPGLHVSRSLGTAWLIVCVRGPSTPTLQSMSGRARARSLRSGAEAVVRVQTNVRLLVSAGDKYWGLCHVLGLPIVAQRHRTLTSVCIFHGCHLCQGS